LEDVTTTNVSQYVAQQGIKISKISRDTEISDGILRRCLTTRSRELRADEFMKLCVFLEKSPFDFWPTDKPE